MGDANIEMLSKCISALEVKVTALVESNASTKNDILQKIGELITELSQVKQKVESVVTENVELRSEIKILHVQLNEVRQHGLSQNMLIRGVPETELNDTQLRELTLKCINLVECLVDPSELLHVTRIGRKIDGKNRPILVKFYSEYLRDNVIALKKKRRIKISEISQQSIQLESPDDLVYFDEHITRENAVLFGLARKLYPMGAKFVWLKRGRIFVRLEENGPVKLVRCASDVSKIQKLLMKKPGTKTPKRIASSPLADESEDSDGSLDESSVKEDSPKVKKPTKKSQKNQLKKNRRKKAKNHH